MAVRPLRFHAPAKPVPIGGWRKARGLLDGANAHGRDQSDRSWAYAWPGPHPLSPKQRQTGRDRVASLAMDLSSPLFLARMTQRLSQAELAELAGVTARTIGRLELGQHSPKPLTAYRLADALGIPPADLWPA
jgi:DNA-binding XRE family transcriptional regulator